MRELRSNWEHPEKHSQLNAIIPHGGRKGCDATKEEPGKTGWRGGEEVGLQQFLLEEMAANGNEGIN